MRNPKARWALAAAPALLLLTGQVAEANTIPVTTTIQAAVNTANPGDKIIVPKGTYHENVLVSKDDITIQGGPNSVLDGTGVLGNNGIRVGPTGPATQIHRFHLNGMRIQNYPRNGVILLDTDHFVIRNGIYSHNEAYGIFPIRSPHGLVEGNVTSGSDDSGIYIGQSSDVLIQQNFCFDNTTGIEIENSSDIVARNNLITGNSLGISVFVVPGLDATATERVLLTGNLVHGNNRVNPVTEPDEIVSRLPSGLGILLVACDQVQVKRNTVLGNKSGGIAMISLPDDLASLDPRVEPHPDGNTVVENLVVGNATDPDPKIAPLPGADLLWDITGTGNRWIRNRFGSSFPSPLPS